MHLGKPEVVAQFLTAHRFAFARRRRKLFFVACLWRSDSNAAWNSGMRPCRAERSRRSVSRATGYFLLTGLPFEDMSRNLIPSLAFALRQLVQILSALRLFLHFTPRSLLGSLCV